MALPNILYLHSHDTGRYVQPYGEPGADAQRAGARGPGSALSPGLLRGAHLLGQPRMPADRPVRAEQRDARAWPIAAGRCTTTAITSCTRCATVGYSSTLIGEQHISKEPDVIGYDEVMKIPTTPRRDGRAAGDGGAPSPA